MSFPPGPPPPNLPPPGPPPPGQGGTVAAMALAGAASFIGVNAVAGFVAFMIAASSTEQSVGRAVFAMTAVVSAASAFVGGWLLIRLKRPIPKGFGMGLMIGWALVTVCTAGICTAINPELYTTMFGMPR